jgi:DNA-binding LacI/PurR family transcriptional regulator
MSPKSQVSKVTVSGSSTALGTSTLPLRGVEQAYQAATCPVAARSLRSKRTHALALIVPDVTNPFWTTVARGVEDAAQSGGYSVLLCNTDENPKKQSHYIDVVISQRVTARSLLPVLGRDLKRLRAFDPDGRHRPADRVRVDCVTGIFPRLLPDRHLVQIGHRRLHSQTPDRHRRRSHPGYIYALETADRLDEP